MSQIPVNVHISKSIHEDVTVLHRERQASIWSRVAECLQLVGLQHICSIDGLVQDCCISNTLAMEILQSCTKPWIWCNPHGLRNGQKGQTENIYQEEGNTATWRKLTKKITKKMWKLHMLWLYSILRLKTFTNAYTVERTPLERPGMSH